ncbi:F-box/kelch-repeat protein At1g26930-like [Nymphaea colorata]|nr:F-box/kelch-repeat protein At1g26930-like [Nymphaea colorata]XP_031491707.1 F-box/kelch-repeat protein At1g26930-like [Nymphaea colorata]XP_031491708.1 F-box/kelch-repeat protein At1g26930-like [Nymphaea colorata]XP_031491710.1 F-box/kelch-repeat protein At1g26930-like [Nymphaea colorata]XP_031491711.1 F-box/kelch-repeat protein At1g26930-like [Nymphaea colorata]XP_049935030.1 F-box/kelch-repeat protein At1g26930-like [Nymphaea colorata]
MLDGRSCVAARPFFSSCDSDKDWCFSSSPVDPPKTKRRLEGEQQHCDEDDVGTAGGGDIPDKKPCLSTPSRAAPHSGSGFRPLSPRDDQSGQQAQGDPADGSLINGLDRDMSLQCLVRCSRSDYGSISSLNHSFNSLVRSGELYRLRRMHRIVEHWVYFACSLVDWEAFDPQRRRWMHLPRMPSNDCFMFSDKESLAVGTELLVFGKDVNSHRIWRYSILTNSWSPGPPMESPRCLFGSASLGEIAIVAGGCDINGQIFSSAEMYNSERGGWIALPSMNSPRKMCSGFFMDGKFYVIGGMKSQTESLTCGEELDLDTLTWRTIPYMSPCRGEAAGAPPLVAVVSNELYAADCSDANVVKKYNKERNAWDVVGRLPERADSMNGWGLAFKACGERVIVIGGQRGPGAGQTELNAWKPKEGLPAWNLLASKALGSFVYNCSVMGC